MQVYADPRLYKPNNRYHLNYICKFFWNDLSPSQRGIKYPDLTGRFEYSPSTADADACFLTMLWPYYVEQGLVAEAEAEAANARQHGKPFVVFSGGDFPANLPFQDAILFESAGYRSTPGLAYHSGMPSFTKDLLQIYCGGGLQLRAKPSVPVIGFCGQASTSALQTAYRTGRNTLQRLQYRLGLLKWEPAPFETSSFRRRVLRQFENQPGIQTSYLLRQRYRAGDNQDKSDQHPARMEFIHNILDSDYTVCMRGGGNFSVRFYETLSLGRIPIFIDSDCLLPFEDRIDYRSLFPWISLAELPRAAEIARQFHQRLSDQDFIHLQHACRRLWLEHFTPNGFYWDLEHKLIELR